MRISRLDLFFLPVTTRVPLKFGAETLTEVQCARVRLELSEGARTVVGWGETPLSVQWGWPGSLPYQLRLQRMQDFCKTLGKTLAGLSFRSHVLEFSYRFLEESLHELRIQESDLADGGEMPLLAALICYSAFDLAMHDAFGHWHQLDTYQTYSSNFVQAELRSLLDNCPRIPPRRSIADYLQRIPRNRLSAWHLVGGLDPLSEADLQGNEPKDEWPVLLGDWIDRDGLKCLKIKLRGTDADWDYQRIVAVGKIALSRKVEDLSLDFNCTVHDPQFVVEVLRQLERDAPELFDMVLYVEQPFPADLEKHPIPVHQVSKIKPLFLDESAHDWRHVRLGLELGWSGVALKTCKTQTGALLSACWAQAHGMQLMVQDLTNPMLAQIPHCRLAAHLPTIRGVETNAMQFYPAASAPEAEVHPDLYRRRNGQISLATLQGNGFGYRVEEIKRALPMPVGQWG